MFPLWLSPSLCSPWPRAAQRILTAQSGSHHTISTYTRCLISQSYYIQGLQSRWLAIAERQYLPDQRPAVKTQSVCEAMHIWDPNRPPCPCVMSCDDHWSLALLGFQLRHSNALPQSSWDLHPEHFSLWSRFIFFFLQGHHSPWRKRSWYSGRISSPLIASAATEWVTF